MHLLLRKYGMFMLLLGHFLTQAQYTSNLGRFSIPFERGCAPVTINVTESASVSSVTNSYYYESNQLDVNDTFHTYTNPGIYEIVQLTQIDNQVLGKTDTLRFEVLANTSPQFEIYECGLQTVQVAITESIYDYYRIHFTANDSVDYIPGDPAPFFTYPTNNVQVLVEGYYYNSYPTCSDTFKSINLNNTLAAASVANASMTQTCGNLFDINMTAVVLPNVKYQVELSFGGGPFTQIY